MKNFYLLLILMVFMASCEPVYKAANHDEMIKKHKVIAVLPTKAFIEIKTVAEADKVKAQEKIESKKLQESFANRFIEWKTEKGVHLDIQPISETNRILEENNVVISKIPYKDLCELLNVDAIVTTKVTMAKPLTNAEAFFSMLATGLAFDSKVTTADVSIIDRESGRTAWNFNWQSGGTFVSTDNLTKSLMQAAIKRFPYKKELASK